MLRIMQDHKLIVWKSDEFIVIEQCKEFDISILSTDTISEPDHNTLYISGLKINIERLIDWLINIYDGECTLI